MQEMEEITSKIGFENEDHVVLRLIFTEELDTTRVVYFRQKVKFTHDVSVLVSFEDFAFVERFQNHLLVIFVFAASEHDYA